MFSETTREDKLRKDLDSTVSIKKSKGPKGKREIDDIQQANRSLPASITIEKKQFILKLSPVDKDRSPIFPKCSHNIKNKINRPFLTTSLDNDEDNFQKGIHDMTKQYETEDSHKKTPAAKSKEKGKPKHHNKFIYYTRDNEETAQMEEARKNKPKQAKSHMTVPALEKQFAKKLHHAKTHKITSTKAQKVYLKEKSIDHKLTSKIKDPESEIYSQLDRDKNVRVQTGDKPHTNPSTLNDLLNTDDSTTTQETVNIGQFDPTANADLGVDIFLSTIQPYFGELHKQYAQTKDLGYSPTDIENTSIQNEYFLQPTLPERIYNKLLKPNIFKIVKVVKSKRFITSQDVGKPIDVDIFPAINIQPINYTQP